MARVIALSLGFKIRDETETMEYAFARKASGGWNWCGWLEYWEALRPDKQPSCVQDTVGRLAPADRCQHPGSVTKEPTKEGQTRCRS